jgi:hypothetical protein
MRDWLVARHSNVALHPAQSPANFDGVRSIEKHPSNCPPFGITLRGYSWTDSTDVRSEFTRDMLEPFDSLIQRVFCGCSINLSRP